MFFVLLMAGCAESTLEIEDKPPSLVAVVEEVVEWVMDNYSSIEDGFAGAENDLRSSDTPVTKILDDLAKLVSDRRIQSEGKKMQLIALRDKLEGKKLEVEKEMMAADSSMRDSYGLALEKIEGKLDGKIKPLLDFDFQYLEKFEMDLNEAILEWKRYLGNVNGVLEEGLIRNELANRISDHFLENMAKPIEERRGKWGKGALVDDWTDGARADAKRLANSKYPESFEIIKNGAIKGDHYYEAAYAEVLRRGEYGSIIDEVTALKWAKKSSASDHPLGLYNIWALKKDDMLVSRIFNGLKKLAADGSPRGQANLGFMYDNGHGVQRDYKEAVKWYRFAAEQGFAHGQANLGFMYENGHGVPQDYKEAVKWYRKAAEQGYARGQTNLGVMYQNGHGVPKDYIYAYAWYNLAASNGSETGLQNRTSISTFMKSEQIALSQELTRELQDNIDKLK